MLEKRILINAAGVPIMETRTNSHTVVRRALSAEERVAFDASQKESLSAEVSEKKEGVASELPPIVSEPVAVGKPTPVEAVPKAKAKKADRPVGKPVA